MNPQRTESLDPLKERGGMTRGGEDEDDFQPTEEDLAKSTMNLAQPLRALQRFKKRAARGGRRGNEELDVVGLLSQINEQFAKADELEDFLQVRKTIHLLPPSLCE